MQVIRSALHPLVLLQLLFCTSWATIKGAVTCILMMQVRRNTLLRHLWLQYARACSVCNAKTQSVSTHCSQMYQQCLFLYA